MPFAVTSRDMQASLILSRFSYSSVSTYMEDKQSIVIWGLDKDWETRSSLAEPCLIVLSLSPGEEKTFLGQIRQWALTSDMGRSFLWFSFMPHSLGFVLIKTILRISSVLGLFTTDLIFSC